ncbi:MAG TPA: inositol monophosphatase family protein [Planctomycetota bacterium]|nr:inositol monophosphatase family protein [Planctomycetota bacterium]
MSALDSADLRAIADAAEELARAAGAKLLEHFQRLDPSEIRSKGVARDLVSSADLASERCLVEGLRARFPAHAIEAEEETRDARGAADELRWFLDPLDGTVNFVHGLPVFAVSMGLWRGGEPLVGVVHAPRLCETFRAVRGGGATLDGRTIRVSDCERLGDAVLATGFPYRRETLEHSNLENFQAFFYDVRGLRRMGSAAIDLCYTAAGRFDGYWELHLSPHDVAAGGLIVREAGGRVADADGGDDWLRGGSLVAAGPALFEAVRERVRH